MEAVLEPAAPPPLHARFKAAINTPFTTSASSAVRLHRAQVSGSNQQQTPCVCHHQAAAPGRSRAGGAAAAELPQLGFLMLV